MPSPSKHPFPQLRHLATKRRWATADGRLVMQAWRASRLSLAAFARATGLAEDRLRWWARHHDPVAKSQPIQFVPAIVDVGEREGARSADGVTIVVRGIDGLEVELAGARAIDAFAVVLAEIRRGDR